MNARVTGKLCEMYQLYVNELSKVIRLLLMLATRLARTDNALDITKDDSSEHRVFLFYLFAFNASLEFAANQQHP